MLSNSPEPVPSFVFPLAVVGFPSIDQQTPLDDMMSPLSEITFPPDKAELVLIDKIGLVVTS